MAGGSLNHNRIGRNLLVAIDRELSGRGCEVFGLDMRVHVEASDSFFYPDAFVVCGEPDFSWLDAHAVTNPKVIIEVLSPSNERYDRGEKFRKYRELPSFCEYLLVNQERPEIERFVKSKSGMWTICEVTTGLEGIVQLETVGVSLPLGELYRRVDFMAAS